MSEPSGAPSVDSLWDRLGTIPDRRGRKGRRYGLASVLVLALSAMLAGANDLRAVFRWGRRLPPEALFLFGLERAPCHATYHCFFKALDVEAAEAVLGTWVRGSEALGHVALDGKRLRGSTPAGHDGSAGVHLVAAFASRLGGVIGQWQAAPDGNEITAALALLKALPLQGMVVTGDAVFCQRAICQTIRDEQGAYLFAVKANQPALMADLAVAFDDAFPPELVKALCGATPPTHDRTPPPDLLPSTLTVDKGHGRVETRQLAVSREGVAHLGWTGAAQVCRSERASTVSHEIAYAVTSLSPEQADPDTLLALWRDHWLIENRLERRLGLVVPDVVLTVGGRELIVEVCVTHRCDADKIARIRAAGVAALEIDLSRCRGLSPEAVAHELVEGAPRHWLFNGKVETPKRKTSEPSSAAEKWRPSTPDTSSKSRNTQPVNPD